MNKFLIITALSFVSFAIGAQEFEGNYKDKTDSLFFSNEKVIFNVGGFSGLYVNKKGEGSYEQIGNYLLIHTTNYSGKKTTVKPIDGSKKDSVVVKVTENQNFPVSGVYGELLNAGGKLLVAGVSNENGKILYKKNPKAKKIKIGLLGYDEIIFDYAPNKDFVVTLAKDDIIENQTVVFKVEHQDEETISIILLSDNFVSGKDKLKSLEKLDKKAQKGNVLDKRLKKEYISVYRR